MQDKLAILNIDEVRASGLIVCRVSKGVLRDYDAMIQPLADYRTLGAGEVLTKGAARKMAELTLRGHVDYSPRDLDTIARSMLSTVDDLHHYFGHCDMRFNQVVADREYIITTPGAQSDILNRAVNAVEEVPPISTALKMLLFAAEYGSKGHPINYNAEQVTRSLEQYEVQDDVYEKMLGKAAVRGDHVVRLLNDLLWAHGVETIENRTTI